MHRRVYITHAVRRENVIIFPVLSRAVPPVYILAPARGFTRESADIRRYRVYTPYPRGVPNKKYKLPSENEQEI